MGLSPSLHTCCHVSSSDITSCTLPFSLPMTSAVTGRDCCGVSACLHLLCRPSAPVQQAQTGRQMAAPLTSPKNYKLRCFFHFNFTNVPGMMAPVLMGNGFPFNKRSDWINKWYPQFSVVLFLSISIHWTIKSSWMWMPHLIVLEPG